MFLGAGLFLGSVGYGRFGAGLPKRKVINVGLCMSGLAIVIFALGLKWWPYFFVAGGLSLLIGIFASPIVVSSNTLLHEVMEDKMRGRTFSSVDIIMHVAFLIFMVLTSVMAELVSKVVILTSIGVVFSGIGALKLIKDKASE
jgi:MFS family permease